MLGIMGRCARRAKHTTDRSLSMVWQRVAGNAESCLGVRGPVEIGCLSLLAFMRETPAFLYASAA